MLRAGQRGEALFYLRNSGNRVLIFLPLFFWLFAFLQVYICRRQRKTPYQRPMKNIKNANLRTKFADMSIHGVAGPAVEGYLDNDNKIQIGPGR